MYHLKVPVGKHKGKKKNPIDISNMFGAVFASALYSNRELKWTVDIFKLTETFGF